MSEWMIRVLTKKMVITNSYPSISIVFYLIAELKHCRYIPHLLGSVLPECDVI